MDASARFYIVGTAVHQIIANRWNLRSCPYSKAVMVPRPRDAITISLTSGRTDLARQVRVNTRVKHRHRDTFAPFGFVS